MAFAALGGGDDGQGIGPGIGVGRWCDRPDVRGGGLAGEVGASCNRDRKSVSTRARG